jgi:hypothetical protein
MACFKSGIGADKGDYVAKLQTPAYVGYDISISPSVSRWNAVKYFIAWSMSLFVYWLVYSRTCNFSAIWRLSPLPVTGLQILAYARRSGSLSREGSLSCHTYCDTGPRFIQSHPKDRHLSPTVGFEPPTQGSSDHCARRSNHCATQASDKML